MASGVTAAMRTPFDSASPAQSLEEALEASVRCARQLPFYRRELPEGPIGSVEAFQRLVPFTSRVDLSMAAGLSELVTDHREVFRGVYPFHQNATTFPFQVVAGDKDLFVRHDRMTAILEAAGFGEGGETLILTSPPQYFFASDLCAEIFFEGHHCSMQDVTGMDAPALRERIEAFGAELVVLATAEPRIGPDCFPPRVRALVTFRGAYPRLARELAARVVDVYTLTEAPYLGHRLAGERLYRYDPDHFFLERSPSGHVAVTSLLWEVMPLVRYRTYDGCGEVRDAEGLFEVTAFGEW